MNKPAVSVIIPVYNGEKTIKRCLESILACRGIDFEIIVIDDGSTDGTLSIIKEYPCRIISLERNQGRSAARNRGIEQSGSDHLLFTDADCIVCKDWVRTAYEEFVNLRSNDPLIAAAEGRILPLEGFISLCDAYSGYGYNQNLDAHYHEHFCTANIIADKIKLTEAGLFNEKMPDLEDQDLGFRLLEKGFRLYYKPSFSVQHNHLRQNLASFLRHYYDWGRSTGNRFEILYPRFRKMPLSRMSGSYFFYLMATPFVALAISLRIIIRNLTYFPFVLFLFPFIFSSKVAYRIGALDFIRSGRINTLMTAPKER
jgi:glycosyltransferase involved in cell wall biosynthesis